MRKSPLICIWRDDKLVGVTLPELTAADTAPDQFELELVRIFKEYEALKASHTKLKKYLRHTEKCRSKRFNMKERWKCTCGLKEAHAEAKKLKE